MNDEDMIRNMLQEPDQYEQAVNYFIDQKIESLHEYDGGGFLEYFRELLHVFSEQNTMIIDQKAESPIEVIFLRALVLSFIKADQFGLVLHTVEKNVEPEIQEFTKNIGYFKMFADEIAKGSADLNVVYDYLNKEVESNNLDIGEANHIKRSLFKYWLIPMGESYHLTLQPPFPDVVIENRSIRPDMLFWIPDMPNIKVIVECDGYNYHSEKHNFITDRKRDRALQFKGYQVLRYSGTEIFQDPIAVANDIFKHLEHLKKVVGGDA